MVTALIGLHNELGRFINAQQPQPSPNSRAAREWDHFPHVESLKTAYSQGGLLIEVAADQMIAFTKTVTEPAQTIAPWTCVRSLIEAASLAVWLLDPDIEPRIRVQRSLAFRYEGLEQQQKIAKAAGDESSRRKIDKRLETTRDIARKLGISEGKSNKAQRHGIGQEMPTITNLIKNTLDEEVAYRLFSALAHAHSWALIQVSFQRTKSEPSLIVLTQA